MSTHTGSMHSEPCTFALRVRFSKYTCILSHVHVMITSCYRHLHTQPHTGTQVSAVTVPLRHTRTQAPGTARVPRLHMPQEFAGVFSRPWPGHSAQNCTLRVGSVQRYQPLKCKAAPMQIIETACCLLCSLGYGCRSGPHVYRVWYNCDNDAAARPSPWAGGMTRPRVKAWSDSTKRAHSGTCSYSTKRAHSGKCSRKTLT